MKILLDTSAYSNFKRGDSQVVRTIVSARQIGVPSIVLGELRTGFLMGDHPERNESELQEFLGNPVVRILDVDDESSHYYAQLVMELREAGTPVPTNDIWIAALAIREGATVLSYDQHFALIQRIGSMVLQLSH